MGAGTAARLLILQPSQVKSGILAGIGDYAIEGTVLEFPKSWPVPEHLPKPLTHRIWAEEGAKVLEQGQIIPGHLGIGTRNRRSRYRSRSKGACGRDSGSRCGPAQSNPRTGFGAQWPTWPTKSPRVC